MKKASYISTYIIYPNNVVTEDYLKGVSGHLIYNRKKHADITYETEFDNLNIPKGKIIKMSHKKWIDKFFETGSLRLGTLDYFRSLDDPEKGDIKEGSTILVGQGKAHTAFVEITSGFNNYVFCCYDGEANLEVIKRFDYDDYFIITDPVGFAKVISEKIKSVNSYQSRCLYKRDKVLVGKAPDNFDFNVISTRLSELVSQTKYFIKTENYKHQNEFRFIWETKSDVKEPLDIKCPEALSFCKRK